VDGWTAAREAPPVVRRAPWPTRRAVTPATRRDLRQAVPPPSVADR